MKIAVTSSTVLPSPPPYYGGLEYVAFAVAYKLSLLGHDVYLFGAPGSEGSAMHYLGYRGLDVPDSLHFIESDVLDINAESKLVSSYKDMEFDYLIDESWSKGFSVFNARSKIGILHAPDHYVDTSEHLYAVSKYAMDRYINYNPDAKIDGVLNNFILEEFYDRSEDKENLVLYLARIDAAKGINLFIRACGYVKSKCVVLGDDSAFAPNFKYVTAMYDLAKRHGVEWVGLAPHSVKVDYLRRAKAVVVMPIPPYIEVFGIWALEAMVSGAYPISTPYGGMIELASGYPHYSKGFFMYTNIGFTRGIDVQDVVSAIELSDSVNRRKIEIPTYNSSDIIVGMYLNELKRWES